MSEEKTQLWKKQVLTRVEELLQELPDDHLAQDDRDVDLYSILESLTALTQEHRLFSRKNTESMKSLENSFSQLSEGQTSMLNKMEELSLSLAESHSNQPEEPKLQSPLPLIMDLIQRVERLSREFSQPPVKTNLWNADKIWRHHWARSSKGISILGHQLHKQLEGLGLVRMDVVGKVFDPISMVALQSRPDALTKDLVCEEVSPGYFAEGKVFKCAEVIVSSGEK